MLVTNKVQPNFWQPSNSCATSVLPPTSTAPPAINIPSVSNDTTTAYSVTDNDLTVAGLYVANHPLASRVTSLAVRSNSGMLVNPDSYDTSNLSYTVVSLESYRPLVGSWSIVLEWEV